MGASVTPHLNGALLLGLSFWLWRAGDCRSANNDFFDNIPVDNSPWQPIPTSRDSPRPSSPKFPPIRYPNAPNHAPNHASNHAPPQPQWVAPFNRASTTEKFKDGPGPKPKFPSSVDGYKSYSPGPFYNPNKDYFDSQPPFVPYGDDFKRPPPHGLKPTKENPAHIYKEPGEPPLLGPKPRPTTPASFELNPGLAPNHAPNHAYSDSRKKVKFPPPTGSSFSNDKTALKTSGRFPPLEHDQNSVRDGVNETSPWNHGLEAHKRGQSKFHQNSVAVREVSPSEGPALPPNQKGQRVGLNRTVSGSRPEVKGANELKPPAHVIYSNTAQLVDDPPVSLSDNEEFHPKDFVPGNIISQITSVRTRPSTAKPLPDAGRVEMSTEKPPQNELANTVPILEGVPSLGDKVKDSPVSEETTGGEAKRKFPFRRPQLLTTTSSERPTTIEPSRRPTMKTGLKTRINPGQKLRTSTEVTTEVEVTELPVRVKNHKDDMAQSNDIPLKAARPTVDYNRRRPSRPTQGEAVPPSGWALASFKNFTSRTTRRPATEMPTVAVTELPAKVRPFVAWSTRLQKMTTTESTATDMTTLMDDEEEMTTYTPDTMKYSNVAISTPSGLSVSKGASNSSKAADKLPSSTSTPNRTLAEETNNIGSDKNHKVTLDSNRNDETVKEDSTNSDGDENITEGIDGFETDGSSGEREPDDVETNPGKGTTKKTSLEDMKVSSPASGITPPIKMKNEVMHDKDIEAEQDSMDEKGSPVNDKRKPTENHPIANDEVEFVEANNNSNAHGLDETNDLKPKPFETIYLTDVKPDGFTKSANYSEVSTNTSSVNQSGIHTNSPVASVPFSYQNNSSQSNELNTEGESGTFKGVSSQDLGGNMSHPPTSDIANGIKEIHEYHDLDRNKSHRPELDTSNKIKGSSANPTEADGMFEVSFDLPPEKTPSTDQGLDEYVSKKLGHSTTGEVGTSQETSSSSPMNPYDEITSQYSPSVPIISSEEIPDFEFSSYRPELSPEPSENPSSIDRPATKNIPKSEVNKSSTMPSLKPAENSAEPGDRSTQAGEGSFNVSTTSVHSSPAFEITSPTERTTFNSSTSTSLAPDSGGKTTKRISTAKWPVFETSKATTQPFSKMEYVTAKTSISSTAVPTTVRSLTSTKKNENIIPPVPDKFDETNATDEDMYIETDSDQDFTSPTPLKPVTTSKTPSSNMSQEISEADLCPSTMLCPVPLHVQLRVENSQADTCKTLNKLKNSIIKLFRSGTARVQQSEQIKFIDMNPNQCSKEDSSKATDVKFYLSDGIGDFEQSINEEFIELYEKMGLQDYEPKVESAQIVMNKGDKDVSVGSDMDGSKTRVIAAVVIICLAVICLILVILLLMIIRKRQKRFNYGQRCVPVTLDDYSLDNISVYNSVRRKGDARASKRSYGNPAFDDPNGPTHRMNFAGLSNFTSDRNAIDEEFASIPVVAVKPDELPPSAETKNRYANVIPLPETRVHLLNTKTGGCSDYINANYVKGPKREEKFYIACQAPLQSTIEDFWRMVWEQQSKVILMLTDFFENGVEKCANYLPPSEVIDCNRVFGDFQVTLKKRENREKYIISSLQLKNLETNSWREVNHLWYTSWPPLGVPNEESSIIAFLIEARVYMKNNTGPNVVHCSPGTGRTGTVIACDLCIRDFELTRMVDVPKCVYMLRRCRAGAVQTKQQYTFIYKVCKQIGSSDDYRERMI